MSHKRGIRITRNDREKNVLTGGGGTNGSDKIIMGISGNMGL